MLYKSRAGKLLGLVNMFRGVALPSELQGEYNTAVSKKRQGTVPTTVRGSWTQTSCNVLLSAHSAISRAFSGQEAQCGVSNSTESEKRKS
jgi:hypothetical protein